MACNNHRCPSCGARWFDAEMEHLSKALEGKKLWVRSFSLDVNVDSVTRSLRRQEGVYLGAQHHDSYLFITDAKPPRALGWDLVDDNDAVLSFLIGHSLGRRLWRPNSLAITHQPAVETEEAEKDTFPMVRLFVPGGIEAQRKTLQEKGIETKKCGEQTHYGRDDHGFYLDRSKGIYGVTSLYEVLTPVYGTDEWKEFCSSIGVREPGKAPRRCWRHQSTIQVA